MGNALWGQIPLSSTKSSLIFLRWKNFLELLLIIINFGGVGCKRKVARRRDWRLVKEA
jgi:hypothetical protein